MCGPWLVGPFGESGHPSGATAFRRPPTGKALTGGGWEQGPPGPGVVLEVTEPLAPALSGLVSPAGSSCTVVQVVHKPRKCTESATVAHLPGGTAPCQPLWASGSSRSASQPLLSPHLAGESSGQREGPQVKHPGP